MIADSATSVLPEGSPVDNMPQSPVPPLNIKREPDKDTPENVKALVSKWQGKIRRAKGCFDTIFTQMGRDQDFLRGKQWETDTEKETKYVANWTQHVINEKVSQVYAKNPKANCRRRKTLDFKIWDGERASLSSLQAIMNPQPQPIAGPGGAPMMDPATGSPMMGPPAPPDPNAIALLQDVQQGLAKRFMMDRIATTLEIIFEHEIKEQNPPFKKQMKQMIKRVLTNSVGYVKIGYQRFLQRRLEDSERVTDITQRLADIAATQSDLIDEEIHEDSPEVAKLTAELDALRDTDSDHVSREGLVFDFPKSRSIIIDPCCTQLSGFTGAQWVAQEYHLTKEDVEEIFGVDVGLAYTGYSVNGENSKNHSPSTTPIVGDKEKVEKERVCLWEIYAKKEGLVYYVADGYPDFLQKPAPPEVRTNRFWPWFPLCFNEGENENMIYPVSDVGLMRPMQLEYNRARNGLREHRYANRPATAVAQGALDQTDEDKLTRFPANALIKIKGLGAGQKIEELLQVIKRPPIDPALYETNAIMSDVQIVTGSQQANMGTTNSSTATQSGIAESSRMSSTSSYVDDLEDMLNELFGAGGEILFSQMSAETATDIAGPGAVWPELTAQDISNELYLEVEGGSSGIPNQAVAVANAEKLIPLIMQIPGVSPEFVLKLLIKRLDDNLDPTDAVSDAVESIVSMNRGAQGAGPGAAMAASDPHMQGPQGGQQPPRPGMPPPSPGGPPGTMPPHPQGPKPQSSGPAGHVSIHPSVSGPIPGSPPESKFVNPMNT